MTSVIILNVGGTIFQTTKSTLTKFHGYFKTMLETGVPVTKDESGAIFIDTDPKHFRLILNFMRDGHVDLPNVPEDVKEIRKEADYYLLQGLVELCQKHQKLVELEYQDKLRHITSDEEMFSLIYMPKKPVMVFFGPVQSGGAIRYPEIYNLLEFQKTCGSVIDIYITFQKCADKSTEKQTQLHLFIIRMITGLHAYTECDRGWHCKMYANGKILSIDLKHDGNEMNTGSPEEVVRKMMSQMNL